MPYTMFSQESRAWCFYIPWGNCSFLDFWGEKASKLRFKALIIFVPLVMCLPCKHFWHPLTAVNNAQEADWLKPCTTEEKEKIRDEHESIMTMLAKTTNATVRILNPLLPYCQPTQPATEKWPPREEAKPLPPQSLRSHLQSLFPRSLYSPSATCTHSLYIEHWSPAPHTCSTLQVRRWLSGSHLLRPSSPRWY